MSVPSAFAYDLVVVNSNDWVDVYNSLLYGSLTSTPVMFLSDQSQSNVFFNGISYSTESILLVESDQRLSPTASKILSSLGYEVDVLTDEDTSLFFSSELNVDSYILVDKNFPSNGLSVAPYAAATNSWVFFVENTLDPNVLDEISGSNIISYGRVSQQWLQSTTPSLVIDKGNKYINSIEIAKEFLSFSPTKQYVLTQGSFLESEFFIDSFPVIIVGVSSTPKPVEDFFISSDVESAVVIGQLSVPPSVNLKRLLESRYDKEIKLVAKLGQTASELDNVDDILPLSTYPIPSPDISIVIESAFYNRITQQLEVRFSNDGDVLTTYVPSVLLTIDGVSTPLEAANEYYVLERSESRTIQFPISLDEANDISAQVTAVYGESQDSLDLSTTKEFSPLDAISVIDNSLLSVEHIVYDSKHKVFLIEVFNNGSVPAYADIDLNNVIIGGLSESFSTPRPILIQPGASGVLVIYAVLSDVDIIANPFVDYDLSYGQRDFALIKSQEGQLPLEKKSSLALLLANSGLIVGLVSIVVIGILLFFLLRRRVQYECVQCGVLHNKRVKRCKRCGYTRFKKVR